MNDKKHLNTLVISLIATFSISFDSLASPEIFYDMKSSRAPANFSNLCNADSVYKALKEKGEILTPPVDLNVRGITGRTPYRIEDNSKIGSYGETRKNEDGSSRFHTGTDLVADTGEPVRAIMDGKIRVAANHLNKNGFGLGNYIWLESEINIPPARNCKVIFGYAHLKKFSPRLKVNMSVKAGDILGEVGRSGYDNNHSIPTHLHVELWVNKYSYKNKKLHTRNLIPLYKNNF